MIRPMAILSYNHDINVLVSREDLVGGYPVYSGALFCPQCGSIWAWLLWNDERGPIEPRSIPCLKHSNVTHPDLRPVAGSLLDNSTINGYDSALLNVLPPDLLQREFILTINAYEELLCPPNQRKFIQPLAVQ